MYYMFIYHVAKKIKLLKYPTQHHYIIPREWVMIGASELHQSNPVEWAGQGLLSNINISTLDAIWDYGSKMHLEKRYNPICVIQQ